MIMPSDRRKEPRLEREERLFIKQVFSGDPEYGQAIFKASTADLSAGGLCLIASREIPEGARLELWLELRGRKAKFFLVSEVCWCKQAEDAETWSLGVALKDAPSSDLSQWQLMFPSSLAPDEL
jgi:Tfp pilus assembly protein PilZ